MKPTKACGRWSVGLRGGGWEGGGEDVLTPSNLCCPEQNSCCLDRELIALTIGHS